MNWPINEVNVSNLNWWQFFLVNISIYSWNILKLNINLSTHLPIYLSIHLSIHPSIYLSIQLTFYLTIQLSIYPSIYLYINTAIYLCIHQSIYPSIYRSMYLKCKIFLKFNCAACVNSRKMLRIPLEPLRSLFFRKIRTIATCS